jgi:hypothetical protein
MIEFAVIGSSIILCYYVGFIRLVLAQGTTTVSNLVTKERRKVLKKYITS